MKIKKRWVLIMKMKKIALTLLLSVSVNMVGSQLAFAAETKSVTVSIIESKLGDLDNFNAFNPNKMTESEKSDIISFLNTLTDYKFINDKRFSDPNAN